MPSSMVHLKIAYEYNPTASPEFWVGNLAPDSIGVWKEKDRFHLRDIVNREQALRALADTMPNGDLFLEGMLLHLFTDWKWDEGMLQHYIKSHNPGDWYKNYRTEMGLLSARMYHENLWSAKVWDEMIGCDIGQHNKAENISSDSVLSMLTRANNYHISNPLAEPLYYTVAEVNDYVAETVNSYMNWRRE